MYLVDTNIISESMKPMPDANVLHWLIANGSSLYLSSITIDELWYGIRRMREGRRKRGYREIVESIMSDYAEKTLGFNTPEAILSAEYRWTAKAAGYNPGVQDMMIAAIAKANGMTLVTRNVKDFEFLDLEVLNPFEASGR